MPYVELPATPQAPPLTLRYELRGDRPGAASVVMVHELGGCLESLAEFADEVARRHRVITFDWRGSGMSEKPGAPWTLDDLAEDVLRLADALRLDRPFHLFGVAMGAVIALRFATRHRRRLSRLVLSDPAAEVAEAAREYLGRRAELVRAQGIRPVLEATFGNAFRNLPGAAERWAEYRRRYLQNPPESFARHSEALVRMPPLEARELAAVTCPTLVLTGEHDFIWPPEVGRSVAARLPEARFVLAEGVAHFPPIQDPVGTADRVLRFLDEPPAA